MRLTIRPLHALCTLATLWLCAASAGSAQAQEAEPGQPAQPPAEEAPPPIPVFAGDVVHLADGMVVEYYRVRHVDPTILAKELNENWKALKRLSERTKVAPVGVQFNVGPSRVGTKDEPRMGNLSGIQNVLRIEATADDWPVVRQILDIVDVPQPQVFVEVKVVELTWDDDLRVGLTSKLERPLGDTFFRSAQATFPNRLDSVNLATANFAQAEKYLTFDYMLELAESGARGEVLSKPSVLASQGESAVLQAVDQEPIVQQNIAGNNVVATTQFRDVGVKLEILPVLVGPDTARVRIVAEVSRVSEFRAVTTSKDLQVVNPVISSRNADTLITVSDGATVVIAGLKQESEREVRTGIPVLKDIPVLGWVFGSTSKRKQYAEISFWLTFEIRQPHEARLIIPPGERARTGR